MSSDPLKTGTSYSPADELESVLNRFEQSWREHRHPEISEFLPRDLPIWRAALLELVHLDLEYRSRAGERVQVESYLQRFPELQPAASELVELIATEFEIRSFLGKIEDVEEYFTRFPELRTQLNNRFVRLRASCPPLGISTLPLRLGRFVLHELVGEGTFGVVYRATDLELKRTVALKFPRWPSLYHPECAARFLREARSTAALAHPGIVSLFGVEEIDGRNVLVTEFVSGRTLAEFLQSEKVEIRPAVQLLASIADAVEHAHHHGIVHRDLKPSNILLAPSDELRHEPFPFLPKISDFGLASWQAGDGASHSLTMTGQVLGTPAYMSPEQARGESNRVDARSDIYSLGVLLYKLITGSLPFQGDSRSTLVQVLEAAPPPPRRLNPKIPRDLENICLKALTKEPSGRYQSASALSTDLRRFLQGQSVHARPVSWSEMTWRWCRRKPVVATLCTALVLVTVIAVACVGWQRHIAHSVLAESERRRADAEFHYHQARQAVDDFSKASFVDDIVELARNSKTRKTLRSLQKDLREKALAYHQEFVRQRPSDSHHLASLAQAWVDLASSCHELKLPKDAIDACHKGVAAWQHLVERSPQNKTFRLRLLDAYLLQAKTAPQAPTDAEQTLQAALRLAQELCESNTEDLQFQDALATCHYELGMAQREAGNPGLALCTLAQAAELWERLVEQEPSDRGMRSRLARCQRQRGMYLAINHRNPEAINAYGRARVHYEALQAQSIVAKSYLAHVHLKLGGIFRTVGDAGSSQSHLEIAKDHYIALLQAEPEETDLRRQLGQAWCELGSSYRQTGKLEEARSAHEQACRILVRAVRDNPDHLPTLKAMANGYRGMAKFFDETGDHVAAAAHYQRAAKLHETFVADNPSLRERCDLSTVYHLIGRNHNDAGAVHDAILYLEKAVRIREELAILQPANREYQQLAEGSRQRLDLARERKNSATATWEPPAHRGDE